MVNVLESKDVREEMRKVNFNLSDDLKKYEKDQKALQAMLDKGTFDEEKVRTLTEKLIQERLKIAEQVGKYGTLEGTRWGKDDVAAQRANITAAEALLQSPLVRVEGAAKENFSPILETILRNDKDLKKFRTESEKEIDKSNKTIGGLEARWDGTEDSRKIDGFKKDIFEEQIKVAERKSALSALSTVEKVHSSVTPATVAATTPTPDTTSFDNGRKLADETLKTVVPAITNTATQLPPTYKDAKAAYTAIQEQLKSVGLYGGTIDGNARKFDGKTQIQSQTQKGFQDLLTAINGGKATDQQKAAFEKMKPAIDFLKEKNQYAELEKKLPATAPRPQPTNLPGGSLSAPGYTDRVLQFLSSKPGMTIQEAVETYAREQEKKGGPKADDVVPGFLNEINGYYGARPSVKIQPSTTKSNGENYANISRMADILYAYDATRVTQTADTIRNFASSDKTVGGRGELAGAASKADQNITALQRRLQPLVGEDSKIKTVDQYKRGDLNGTDADHKDFVSKGWDNVTSTAAFKKAGTDIDPGNADQVEKLASFTAQAHGMNVTPAELKAVTNQITAQAPKKAEASPPAQNAQQQTPGVRR